MRQACKFNPRKDVGKVIEGLSVDLAEVTKSGVIPKTSVETVYNQIQELKDVGVRINDDFDAIMISRYLRSQKSDGLTSNSGTASSQMSGNNGNGVVSAGTQAE